MRPPAWKFVSRSILLALLASGCGATDNQRADVLRPGAAAAPATPLTDLQPPSTYVKPPPTEARPMNPAATPGPGERTVALDGVKAYHSLAELVSDSKMIAVVEVQPGVKSSMIGENTFSRIPTEIISVIKGPSQAPLVRLSGELGEHGIEAPLEPGLRYVLFLSSFELPGVSLPDEYVILGVTAGQYRVTGSGNFVKSEPFSFGDQTPLSLTISDITKLL